LAEATQSFAAALVAALDARDPYTAGHSAAVAIYASDIAASLGEDRAFQERARLAGLLHDIGKVGLPSGLLEKPGALSPAERIQMETHSVIGERILINVDGYADLADAVRHHHERIDGGGYPDGLQGDQIPLLSRILAVADAYSAMTSGRPYRAALTPDEARARLHADEGTQFDPRVVLAFESVLQEADRPYTLASRADFTLSPRLKSDWRGEPGAQIAPAAA
jgi:putative nucleotidyltransferase with HDIG domain